MWTDVRRASEREPLALFQESAAFGRVAERILHLRNVRGRRQSAGRLGAYGSGGEPLQNSQYLV